METLYSRLQQQATLSLREVAILETDRALTYAELLGRTDDVAVRLRRAGTEAGDRVALVLPNGSEFVQAFFAVAAVGGVAVPLNPALREPELAALMEDGPVAAVVTVSDLRDRCVGALQLVSSGVDVPVLLTGGEGQVAPVVDSGTEAGPAASPGDPVLCLYSSGSTGRPKRVIRTQGNLLWETDRFTAALGLGSADRVLGVAPFSHVNGLMRSMVASVLSGATLVPLAQFERRAVGRTIQERRVTVFTGVPFMFAMLAETRWPQPVSFSSLRLCFSSSAPLPPETIQRFLERYGVRVRQLYGTTETGTIALDGAPEPAPTAECLGVALDGVEVDIFSEDRRPVRVGDSGDIGIRSPAATREYPGLPDQNTLSFWNGYFFPGDVGYKDPAGRIYLVGRKSLFINRGGFKVNPYEIEALIRQHPKVADIAVIGVDTEYGDQKIKAVVVPRERCAELEIIDFCREQMADFKVPSIVEFRTELPKSSTGKLLRKDL